MSQIATLFCIVAIGYLFWADRKNNNGVSKAILIPLIWFFFSASHYPSWWLGTSPPDLASAEGSPMDRSVFLALIIAAVWVLSRRSVDWWRAVASNPAVWLFFLYCLISAGWADDPLLSLKRFIKGTGNLVMALVILSEEKPEEALAICIRRMSFILLPLSVLYIKYFPSLGRAYFMGEPMYNGATHGKNALGQLCLICGIYFAWELLVRRLRISADGKTASLPMLAVMIPTTMWLLYMADSATSLSCMILATFLLLMMRTRFITKNPDRIFYIAIAGVLSFAALNALFGVKESIILMLGRRQDLTNRDFIWQLVISMQESPWIGYGYESFWTGERLAHIWARVGVEGIIQSHNGYIEVYLNLGVVGFALLVGAVAIGLANIKATLAKDYSFAVLKFTYLVIILIYNYTEATFVPVSTTFVLVLLSVLDVRRIVRAVGKGPVATEGGPPIGRSHGRLHRPWPGRQGRHRGPSA